MGFGGCDGGDVSDGPPSDLTDPPYDPYPDNRYDLFVAHSHRYDRRRLHYLRFGLQHLVAHPWRKEHPLRVFRLNEMPDPPDPYEVWPSICEGMDGSDWFVLLASPDSARSKWVGREIGRWLATKPLERLMIVCTCGDCHWDPVTGGFDRARSSAIHPVLERAFEQQPLILDMRWATRESGGPLNCDPRFFELLRDIAAPILGRPRDELTTGWPPEGLPPYRLS